MKKTKKALGVVWLVGFLTSLLASAPREVAADAKFGAPKDFTLVLGDSIAFGFQSAKFMAALPDPEPAIFDTGLADVFAARLAGTAPGKGSTVVNLSCPGETTASFLGLAPCPYSPPFRLHTEYTESPIVAAEIFLGAHRGQVSPILVTLGINDALEVLDVCGPPEPDPNTCIGTLVPPVLVAVAANLDEALGRLRAMAPDAVIILLQYYNPIAVIDPATNPLMLDLNVVIGNVADSHRAHVADAFPPFNLAPPQPATLCVLTLMCEDEDIHPSDAGYAVIGDLMFTAGGYTRFER
jgi:lysophospholipase L1-like esterase